MNGSANNAMVPLTAGTLETEILDEMMVVADAYRKAQDADILSASDVMSQARSQMDVDALTYFVVAMPWFRTVSPILHPGLALAPGMTAPQLTAGWKEEVGPIPNASLAAASLRPPPPFLNELKKSAVSLTGATNGHKALVSSQWRHAVDYVLVGANVWLLLSQKFGHDMELPVSCVYTPRTFQTTSVQVNVHADDCIPLPTTGRFPYEKYFDPPEPAASCAVVPDDDEVPTTEAKSDDDDDLYPGIDDTAESVASNSTNQMSPKSNGVIYLPPSNTYKPHSDNHWSLRSDNDRYESETSTRMVRRRFGSGLGNLGNTCFMNSTLQCLAHTEPLQRYFLTGAYIPDLNRDNPLGTGGELATQFASLLAEMWCSKQVVRNGFASEREPAGSNLYTSATNVVYPRNFKTTLGKHAEQFMGYDQHDSQELATYLLDALHEDCNRVTKKPYIEKPEQTEDETDQEASDKAWDLHLKREDSRVLENFMGQVKSRVQCCEPECGRVSTTFDPFMFLSVPIPGTEDRTIPITFVPLDPAMCPKRLSVVVNKLSNVGEMLKKIYEMLPSAGCLSDTYPAPAMEDLIVCDVYKKEIFGFLDVENEVEKIRENDDTFVYEVRPKNDIREMATEINESISNEETAYLKMLESREAKRSKKCPLDIETLTRLNTKDAWTSEIMKYTRNPTFMIHNFPVDKPDPENGAKVYLRLREFLDQCHSALEGSEDAAGQKRTRSDTIEDTDNAADTVDPNDSDSVKELCDRSDESKMFRNVTSKKDLAILEFLTGKMFLDIQGRMADLKQRQSQAAMQDGMIIEIRIRSAHPFGGAPFLLRIPSNMTVFGLREELAIRLSRSLKPSDGANDDEMLSTTRIADSNSLDSPELLLLRTIPLSYQRKSATRSFDNFNQLGCVPRPMSTSFSYHGDVRDRGSELAEPSRLEEQQNVAQLVRERGQVFLDLSVDVFDFGEYETVDEEQQSESRAKNTITVLDCIEKFCQMEQLEESEQWYCSRCKSHVCAWKQFHIYRSPPHLIVHLKRFQFSARTHRRQKIGVYVDFPLEGLDLTNQVLHWTDDEKPIYDCYAVSNHYGGLGGGHYTAYALNDGGVWCHYDDSRITSNVNTSEVVSSAAYVLYYRRRDVPVGQDFEMTMPTPEQMVKPPVIIQDAPVHGFGGIGSKLNREPSEISSNAAMIDDEEAMEEDATDVASRSTSPASDDAVRHDYGFSYEDFRTPDEQDEGDSSEPSSAKKASGSLPLQ